MVQGANTHCVRVEEEEGRNYRASHGSLLEESPEHPQPPAYYPQRRICPESLVTCTNTGRECILSWLTWSGCPSYAPLQNHFPVATGATVYEVERAKGSLENNGDLERRPGYKCEGPPCTGSMSLALGSWEFAQ